MFAGLNEEDERFQLALSCHNAMAVRRLETGDVCVTAEMMTSVGDVEGGA